MEKQKRTKCGWCKKETTNKKYCSRACTRNYWKKYEIGAFYGKKFSKEHCKNISKGKLGKPKTEEARRSMLGHIVSAATRKKISIACSNPSEETRKKISMAKLGIPLSEEHKQKIRDNAKNNPNFGMKGKKLSEEAKQKLRDNAKINPNYGTTGQKMSEETKQKIGKKNLGKKRSEEAKAKIKKARATQVLPVKDTIIEVKIQNFLKQLGIEYFTHKYMKEIEHGYQCDVLIPSMNMVIECDGDYWHKYPIGTGIDHTRTSELLEKGFKVLRLWEQEIKVMDVNNFKQKLEQYNKRDV